MTTENERLITLDILMQVLEEKRYCHIVLRQALTKYGYLPKTDRAFISRVSRGCVEQLLELDAMIDRVSSVKVAKMKPVIRNILRMTAYQLRYTNVPPHAACNEAVKLAGKKGFAGLQRFVNGVCRNMARQIGQMDVSGSEELFYSVPSWLLDEFHQWYSDKQVKGFLDAWKEKQDSGLIVHFHLSKASQEQILDSLRNQQVEAEPAPYAKDCWHLAGVDRIETLEAFVRGWIQVQDIGSALCAQCVAPAKDSLCLDLCSAPGGKGIYMAEAMEGSGLVVCRDLSWERLSLIEENRQRCGMEHMVIEQQDARMRKDEDFERFDCVLADVPCSGLGVLGRKPDIKYRLTKEDLVSLVSLQRDILLQAADCVRPDGVLVYSTCTINPKENEENIRWFLTQKPFVLESLEEYLPDEVECADKASGMLQLLPGQNRCDGFFLARLRKQAKTV